MGKNSNTIINALSLLFDKYLIDGYVVPSTDEYLSEYTPVHSRRLEYITGFTGSNGLAIILRDHALFFTDGRYLEQAKIELDLKLFKIFDQRDWKNFPWTNYIPAHYLLGYDPKLFTSISLASLNKLNLKSINDNLIDQVWSSKPKASITEIKIYEEQFAGESYINKISTCRKIIEQHQGQALIISALDSICWLLNIRSIGDSKNHSDVPFSPLILSSIILTLDKVYLFINPQKISKHFVNSYLEISVLPEEDFTHIISTISGRVLIDEKLTSSFIIQALSAKEIIKINDPCQMLKAQKNSTEIKWAIDRHIQDAVAVCEFFSTIEQNISIKDISEYDISIELTNMRQQQSGYISDSFATIAAFQENAAIIHYQPKITTAKTIKGNGLLLIDSGAQYLGATTDITRTLAIGSPKVEQLTYYTKVLKGHLALANIIFPQGVTGANLDILARQFLWQDYSDYAHGTGHGVGSFLSVHEGPQSINLYNNIPLQPGMILSNEPGYYKPGEYGIRIENLMFVSATNHKGYLTFQNLTLVPYCKALINFNLLSAAEIEYIKQYYAEIERKIMPLLSDNAKTWLQKEINI